MILLDYPTYLESEQDRLLNEISYLIQYKPLENFKSIRFDKSPKLEEDFASFESKETRFRLKNLEAETTYALKVFSKFKNLLSEHPSVGKFRTKTRSKGRSFENGSIASKKM